VPTPPEALPITRRRNLQAAFARWSEEDIRHHGSAGVSGRFSAAIAVHPSLLGRLLGSSKQPRDVSDALARQIESQLGLAAGWLDATHAAVTLSKAEESFLQHCLTAYRATDADGRRQLRRWVQALERGASLPPLV
jgi:hypothetical protein